MKFSEADYKTSVDRYEQHSRLLDDTLRRLCSEHPEHTSPSAVHVKLWIIARTYQTGIERKVPLSLVEKRFLSNGRRLDKLMAELRTVVEPLSPENLKTIVRLHAQIVKIVAPNASPRSFVSKYMHFHNSAVPIYDSRAAKTLRSWIRLTDDLKAFPITGGEDKKYAEFTMRFLKLYALVRSKRLPLNVKCLDHYLLWMNSKSRRAEG